MPQLRFPPLPRLTSFAVITLILTAGIGLLAPHLLSVTLYKLSLVTLAAVLGYWIDRPCSTTCVRTTCWNSTI